MNVLIYFFVFFCFLSMEIEQIIQGVKQELQAKNLNDLIEVLSFKCSEKLVDSDKVFYVIFRSLLIIVLIDIWTYGIRLVKKLSGVNENKFINNFYLQ